MATEHDPDRDRRALLLAAGTAGVLGLATEHADAQPARSTPPPAGPVSALGLDASQLGVRPGSPDDQTAAFQRALDRAAAAGSPLALPPGVYRLGGLRLPNGIRLVAAPGSARLVFTEGLSLFTAQKVDRVALAGLVLDGGGKPLLDGRALLQCEQVGRLTVTDCEIARAGGNGLYALDCAGEIAGNVLTDTADVAIMTRNARGLLVARNVIAGAGNNGIQVLRWEPGDDGTLVLDNRIGGIRHRSGGQGPFGNGINIYRADNVIVRGNRIDDCTFSGVRGNSASNLQIVGNTVTHVGETALYSEFQFEAAIVSGNIVDGAQTGISIANFEQGGRVAVVQGNILRDLAPRASNPDPEFPLGVGMYVEAETAATGNVIERAEAAGILVGWGKYLRNVALTGNVVRDCGIGIGVTVVPGGGPALIAHNVLSGCRQSAIVGLDHKVPRTGDLALPGAPPFPGLTIAGNTVG